MDDPEASSHSGSDPAAFRRRASASNSGRIVDIADIPISLHASDSARWAAMRILDNLVTSTAAPLVRLHFGPDAPSVPQDSPDETHEGIRVWRRGPTQYLSYDEVHGTATAGEVQIGGPAEDLERAFYYLFSFSIAHVLACHRRLLLHAGAVSRGGQALVLLGGSGAGKSTTVLAALSSGWRALSDDLVAIRLGKHGRVQACGIPKPIHAPADAVAGMPGSAQAMPNDPRGRWLLNEPEFSRGWYDAKAVVLISHGARRDSQITRIGPTLAFDRVLACNLSTPEPASLRQQLPVIAAMSRLPCWELPLSPEPKERSAVAGEMLRRIAGETFSAEEPVRSSSGK